MIQIISQFADATKVQDTLNGDPNLTKLAYEMCNNFNLKLSQSRTGLRLLTPEGLNAGRISAQKERNHKKSEDEIVYYYSSETIKKDKGSVRSDRRTRDSTSIASLIRTIKKNNEAPTADAILKSYGRGMAYAFTSTSRGSGNASISLSGDIIHSLVLNHLGIDTTSIHHHTNAIREAHIQYERSMNVNRNAAKTFNRFCRGVKLVGAIDELDDRHYLVGVATYDPAKSEVKIQAPLKRYNTLRECPDLATDLPIIRAYTEGTSEFDANNDFGLPWRDKYYEEIDVATGYTDRNSLWVGIPLEHE